MLDSAAMRVFDRLEELYAIGGGRGANRPYGSAAEDAAHDLAAGWMEEAGLAVERDAAGNLLGRFPGEGAELWAGSHLDSVPEGGRFDGALGVATAIVGYARREVVFGGAAGHAGTTPMDQRDDALVAAAEYVLRVRDAARAIPEAVATVGVIEAEPGGVNVVPGRVRLTVDARAPDLERLERLLTELGLELQPRTDPVALDAGLRSVLASEAARIGAAALELPSGAGHDAGILAAAGVPSAMLFVRSLAGGVSHSPDEDSSAEDVALAVDVLAGALAVISAT